MRGNVARGFSLTEILISLSITSIVIAVLLQLYTSTKHQYLEIARLLENNYEIQWVRALLSDSIRKAGFTPCLALDQLEVKDRRTHAQPVASVLWANAPEAFIQTQSMSENFTTVLGIENSRQLRLASTNSIHSQQPIILADCFHAEIHDPQSLFNAKDTVLLTLAQPLAYSYIEPIYIGQWVQEKWFIKKQATGRASLYYRRSKNEELSPLVSRMEVEQVEKRGRRLIQVK